MPTCLHRLLAPCLLLATAAIAPLQSHGTPGEAAALGGLDLHFKNPEIDEIIVASGTYETPGDLEVIAETLFSIDRDIVFRAKDPENPPVFVGGGRDNPFRLFDVLPNVTFRIQNIVFQDFFVSSNGAVVSAADSAFVSLLDVQAENNEAAEDGGVVFAVGGALTVERSTFLRNRARQGSVTSASRTLLRFLRNIVEDNISTGGNGAAVHHVSATQSVILRNIFRGNQHNFNFANHIYGGGQTGAFKDLGTIGLTIDGNVFITPPGFVREVVVRHAGGTVQISNNVFKNVPPDGSAIDVESGRTVEGGVVLRGNLFDVEGLVPARKDLCRDVFGVGLIVSEGYNIAEDASCALDGPGDLPNTDPQLQQETEDGIVALRPNSPAIDSGLADAIANVMSPCSYKDIRGLGRPQDGNGDGRFECDSGPYEVQGGPDIGSAQSAAYFDPARSGEGVFVEILGGGLAFVAVFTYSADGQTPAWFVGLGQVVGNSVVVDEVLQTSGGVFGAGFAAASVVRTDVGGLSLVFPNCESTASPGVLSFDSEPDSGLDDLLVSATRLSTILDCSGPVATRSGRSGSFYDPNRDGEGIFVQWLSNGQAIVIWYTYDPQGNQFWTISADVLIDGSKLTANMLYPAATTGFGSSFDPAEIDLQPWGSVTLEYTSCDNLQFGFNSTVPGFGNGSYSYTRLTGLAGAVCDL